MPNSIVIFALYLFCAILYPVYLFAQCYFITKIEQIASSKNKGVFVGSLFRAKVVLIIVFLIATALSVQDYFMAVSDVC